MSTEKTVPMKFFISMMIVGFIAFCGGFFVSRQMPPPITEKQLSEVSTDMLTKEYRKRDAEITKKILGDVDANRKKRLKEMAEEEKKVKGF